MTLSHKDWELSNSWIWLAETGNDRGLVKRTSKIWKNEIRLVAVRKQSVIRY